MRVIKKYIIIFINILFFVLSACQSVTLMDETMNKFIPVASQGEYPSLVEITWAKTAYYASYDILRSDTEDGEYISIAEKIKADGFKDNNIVSGKGYYYKIRGYNQLGTAMYTTDSTLGYAGSSGGFYPPDKITIVPGYSTKSIELSWNRSLNTVEYEILRSEDKTFFEPIAKTPYLHYRDFDVEPEKTYYYQLTAYDKDGLPSPDRSPVFEGTLFGTNINLTTVPGAFEDRIKISWKAYSLAMTYTIYRSEGNPNNLGIPIAELKSGDLMEYYDLDVRAGVLYYYTVLYQNNTAVGQSEQVRSYTKVDGTPEKPLGFTVAQGQDPKNIMLTWNAVDGAGFYEISRSISQHGPWQPLGTTTDVFYEDKDVPDTSYTYFYTVVGMNPAPGAISDIKEGWANKPPVNITASDSFGAKVSLSWDSVPKAVSYIVKFSETETGDYQLVKSVNASVGNRVVFDHIYDIGNQDSKELYYTIEVITSVNQSLPSVPIKGKIQKIIAPKNIQIRGNKTPTKSMIISWDAVPGARKYRIYQATLKHRNTDPNTIQIEHFKYIGESQNAAYNLSFSYPIRRHKYMVKAVDGGGAEGVGTISEVVWRVPVDVTDFAKDVDLTIIQAQTQIPNFGYMNSGGTISGRASGTYVNWAGMSGSKNIWNKYVSYEIILDGEQRVAVNTSSLSASLSGPLTVSGLYSGTIQYNNLQAYQGGYAFSGGLTITYRGQTETWNHIKAAAEMQAVILSGGSDGPPRAPDHYVDEGNGSDY